MFVKIYTVPEAIELLTRETGHPWDPPKLFDFVCKFGWSLSAAAPLDAVAVRFSLRDEAGRVQFKEDFRGPPGHEPMAKLFPHHVVQLWMRGAVRTSHVDDRGQSNMHELHLYAQPVTIAADDVRIRMAVLKSILVQWSTWAAIDSMQPRELMTFLQKRAGETGDAFLLDRLAELQGTDKLREGLRHYLIDRYPEWVTLPGATPTPALLQWSDADLLKRHAEIKSAGHNDVTELLAEESGIPVEMLSGRIKAVQCVVTWTVNRPSIFKCYGKPLYELLTTQCDAGKPRPTAHEVLEAWRVNPPTKIFEVMDAAVKYETANGTVKEAGLDAIRKAIVRMTADIRPKPGRIGRSADESA